MRKIYLHIGLHKTGSSTIQSSLGDAENNQLLRQEGLLYPRSWPHNHSIPLYSAFCHKPEQYHINIKNGYSIEEIKEINSRNRRLLRQEVRSGSYEHLVISGEDISKLQPSELQSLKKYLELIFDTQTEIKILVYVRYTADFAVSAIQENIKSGKSFKEATNYLEKIVPNLIKGGINKFFNIFGRESVQVFQFEKAIIHKNGLVGHFLETLMVSEETISKIKQIKSNESISQLATEIIGFINEREPLIIDGQINPNRRINDTNPLLKLGGPKYQLPIEIRKKITEDSKEDLMWLRDNCHINYISKSTKIKQKVELLNPEIVHIQLEEIKKELNALIRELVEEWEVNI